MPTSPLKVKASVNTLYDVFRHVNMHDGDVNKCWDWEGTMSPNPVFVMRMKRYQATRIIYGLHHKIPYRRVPQLIRSCGNPKCVNPYHLVKRKGHLLTTRDSFATMG
jgi:hypothetical protein